MTDELPPNQPQPDAPNGADSGLVSADDLDDVLSQAASLATELSSELGTTEDTLNSPGSATAPAVQKEVPADLDRELNDLQQLVATAGEELNDVSTSPSNADGPDKNPQAAESKAPLSGEDAYGVPEFMSEFTEPDAAESAPAKSSESTAEAGSETATVHMPKPGVVGTGMIGVVGTPPPKEATETESPAPVEDQTADDASPPSMVEKALRIAHQAGSHLSPLALRLGLQGVRVLEGIDKPVRGVSPPIRRLIGWVAIATMGTATIVFLISLF